MPGSEQPALDANIGDIVKHRGSKTKVTHVVVDLSPAGGEIRWAGLRGTKSGRRSNAITYNLTIIERASK